MSSSSYEYEHDYSPYEDANEMQSPWYPNFGQPLLYYSQVQPYRNWQRFREPEKDKPNCFKKAFRWYTQERVPFKNEHRDSSSNMNKAHLKGFAAWLDEKYNEFLDLEAGHVEGTKYILTQTSAIEMDKMAFSEQSEKPANKRYKRVKSAWKKRTKYLNAKQKGDIIVKSSQSIEIILKPKELSRPASEYCQRTKVHSCCNRSNSNVQYNATTLHGVTKPKSQSLTSVVKEKEVRVIPFDMSDYDAENDKLENETAPSLKHLKNNTDRKQRRHRSRNVSCQCSSYVFERVNAYSQIEDSETKTQEPCHCKLNKAEMKSPLEYHNTVKKEELVDLGTAAGSSAQSKITQNIDQKDEATFTARTEKNRSSTFVPVDENVQTSDHSINLNEYLYPEHHRYPLFMKIVRVDKL